MARGLLILPEGDRTKVMTFDLAVGISLLTIGCIVPLARFSAAGERRFVGPALA